MGDVVLKLGDCYVSVYDVMKSKQSSWGKGGGPPLYSAHSLCHFHLRSQYVYVYIYLIYNDLKTYIKLIQNLSLPLSDLNYIMTWIMIRFDFFLEVRFKRKKIWRSMGQVERGPIYSPCGMEGQLILWFVQLCIYALFSFSSCNQDSFPSERIINSLYHWM